MQNLINFITGGASDFTPQAIVGVVVFVVIFEGIIGLLSAILSTSKGVYGR